jgi:glutamine amidotransferase-like uncharacterized protein
MPDILVYQDYVHNNGILFRNLVHAYGARNVGFCDASDILDGACLEKARLLIMPGGADLYYKEKLDGQGNANIQTFVENGGAYLGICAGAYYGCDTLSWGAGSAHEISGSRQLGFFKGCAVGPIAEFIQEGDITKSWRNIVRLTGDFLSKVHHAFYAAGPYFIADEGTSQSCEVLARYDEILEKPPAIIRLNYGAGAVVLSAVHIEYGADDIARTTYHTNNPSLDWDQSIAHKAGHITPQLFEKIMNIVYQPAIKEARHVIAS